MVRLSYSKRGTINASKASIVAKRSLNTELKQNCLYQREAMNVLTAF